MSLRALLILISVVLFAVAAFGVAEKGGILLVPAAGAFFGAAFLVGDRRLG